MKGMFMKKMPRIAIPRRISSTSIRALPVTGASVAAASAIACPPQAAMA
jgi:hypothetical protein